jgi:hypothetical protein
MSTDAIFFLGVSQRRRRRGWPRRCRARRRCPRGAPQAATAFAAATAPQPSPLSDELGHHRLLRTSPLTEVPEVCPE